MKRGNQLVKETLGKNPSAASQSESNTARLLRDLQVRQIELELQNEELIQARARTEDAYRQYTDLYDFAPVGYFTLKKDGTVQDVNLAGATLLGAERETLLKRQMALLVTETSRSVFNTFFEKLLSDEGLAFCELHFEKKEGKNVCVHMEATCFEGSHECRAVLIDITERKQAEEALRAAGQQWQDTFDAIGDSISLINLEWRVIKHNRATQALLGKPAAEINGQNCYEVMHGTSQPIENCPFQRMKKSKRREDLVLELNGRWLNVTVDPIFDSGGQLIGGTHIASDITERVLADKALQTSEANLKAIFANSLQSFMLIDKNRTIQSFNGKASKNAKIIFGEEIQPGDSIYKIISPRERESFDRNFDHALAGETIRVEKMFEVKSDILWFEFHYAPVTTRNEISGVFLSTLNITERKQAEKKLRESEEKFRSLVEQSSDGVILIDEQGVIIEWNPAQVNITGISQAQALGAPFWDIQHQLLKLERRRELSPQYLKEAYFQKSKEPDFLKQPQEIKIVAAGGEHKFLQTSSFSIKTQNGCRIGSITHDITERKQTEMELKYTKEGLEKANTELQAALARETKLAHTDALTGINNRRRLFELAEHEFEMAVRYQHPLAVIMFDIDHFKEVNDTFGHTVGDQILQRVAQTASQELRSVDVFGRYGGEEFVIILPMTNAQQAYPLAERIREQVATIRLPTEKGEASVTLSIGIAELRHTAQPKWVETLIRNADETMYHAKQAGRNRTEVEK